MARYIEERISAPNRLQLWTDQLLPTQQASGQPLIRSTAQQAPQETSAGFIDRVRSARNRPRLSAGDRWRREQAATREKYETQRESLLTTPKGQRNGALLGLIPHQRTIDYVFPSDERREKRSAQQDREGFFAPVVDDIKAGVRGVKEYFTGQGSPNRPMRNGKPVSMEDVEGLYEQLNIPQVQMQRETQNLQLGLGPSRETLPQAPAAKEAPSPVTDAVDQSLSTQQASRTKRPIPEWLGDPAKQAVREVHADQEAAGDWRSSGAWEEHVQQGYDAYQKRGMGDLTLEQYEAAAAEREGKHRYTQAFNKMADAGGLRDLSMANRADMAKGPGDIQNERMDAQAQSRIDAMDDGPAKEEAQAQLSDRQANRDMLSPFDRFEGSKGSPDAKAREQRMSNYQNRLDQLVEKRAISNRESMGMMKQAKKAEQEQFKFDEAVRTAEAKEQDLFRKEALREAGIKSEEAITGVNASIHELGMSEGKKFKTGRFSSINLGDVNEQYNAMTPEMQFMVQKQAARLWSKDRDTNKDNMENFLSAFGMVQDMQLLQAKQNR